MRQILRATLYCYQQFLSQAISSPTIVIKCAREIDKWRMQIRPSPLHFSCESYLSNKFDNTLIEDAKFLEIWQRFWWRRAKDNAKKTKKKEIKPPRHLSGEQSLLVHKRRKFLKCIFLMKFNMIVSCNIIRRSNKWHV